MANSTPLETLIDKGRKLSKMQSPQTDAEIKSMAFVPYASAMGSPMYAMLCTSSDICYAWGWLVFFKVTQALLIGLPLNKFTVILKAQKR